MIRTIIYDNKNFPIPSDMVFERLLNLDNKLSQGDVTIMSIFKTEKTPSMKIFLSEENIYRFKDFSSGRYGDIADVAMHLFNINNRQDAFLKILDMFDKNEYKKIEYKKAEPIIKKITSYIKRPFTNHDANFWRQHGCTPKFIKEYNIYPLKRYVFTKIINGVETNLVFDPVMSYGYFNNKGELCKIYNPKNKKAKFIKVKEMIQGEEQLKYNSKYLIIISSMKDIGAFKSLRFKDVELVAPDGEGIMIPKERIEFYKSNYEKVFTMFDNDIAGMQAMKKYKEEYDLPYIYFDVEKDIAECVYSHGEDATRLFIKPVLKDAINRERKKRENKEPNPF